MSQELIDYKKLCEDLQEEAEFRNTEYGDTELFFLIDDATNAIEELQAENERRKMELEWKDKVIELAQRKQAEAEADNARLTADIGALMHAVERDCTYCKHNGEWSDQSPCWHCAGYAAIEFVTGNYWEWMGAEG